MFSKNHHTLFARTIKSHMCLGRTYVPLCQDINTQEDQNEKRLHYSLIMSLLLFIYFYVVTHTRQTLSLNYFLFLFLILKYKLNISVLVNTRTFLMVLWLLKRMVLIENIITLKKTLTPSNDFLIVAKCTQGKIYLLNHFCPLWSVGLIFYVFS